MTALQPDLFGSPDAASPAREPLDPQMLALVQGMPTMPWPDVLLATPEDDAFRYGKGLLPPGQGEARWAVFDREMDRLCAAMDEGLEPLE